MTEQQEKYYERGWHDGVLSILNDIIDHGKTGVQLLDRMNYWASRIERIKKGRK